MATEKSTTRDDVNLDLFEEICSMLRGKVSSDILNDVRSMVANRMESLSPGEPEGAEDEALATVRNPAIALDAAGRAANKLESIREAEAHCAPVLGGGPLGLDSAEAIYGAALNKLGVSTRGLHPSGYKAVFRGHRGGGKKPPTGASMPVSTIPGANRLKR